MLQIVVGSMLMLLAELHQRWLRVDNCYLLGYAARSRHAYRSLRQAQNLCLDVSDCSGVTKHGKYYELRKGSIFKQSPTQEVSWKPVSSSSVKWQAQPSCYFSNYAGGYRHAYTSLQQARNQCIPRPDCNGITRHNGYYELRKGLDCKPSKSGDSSWRIIEPFGIHWQYADVSYLSGYTGAHRHAYTSLQQAKQQCIQRSNCGGVTKNSGMYELRAGKVFIYSPYSEKSWLKLD